MNTNIKEVNEHINNLNNEVARLREEANTWHQHYRDEASKAQKCKQAYIEQEKEVARLRELLNQAIHIAEDFQSNGHDTACYYEVNKFRCRCGFIDASDDLDKLKAESRLATAPEEKCSDDTPNPADMECEDYKTSAHPNKCIENVTEPTIEGVTMDEWYNGFSMIESTIIGKNELPCPFCASKGCYVGKRDAGTIDDDDCYNVMCPRCWCEGPVGYSHKEAIYFWEQRNQTEKDSKVSVWKDAPPTKELKPHRYDDQEPVPDRIKSLAEDVLKLHKPDKQPEWRELGQAEVICEGDEEEYTDAWGEKMWLKVVDCKRAGTNTRLRTRRPLPKQEEMPLEKELNYLTREASRASDIHNHVLIVDCIRYLRDEIQKLKEAK